jgi:putative DNA primase/helicase
MTWRHIEDACRAACLQIGVNYKSTPYDGRFHPADLANDPSGRGDGRIKIFPDRQGGIVQNWKTGTLQTFFIDQQNGAPINAQDRERIKAEQERRQQERKAQQDKTAKRARAIWQTAIPAPLDHPYLIKKQVKSYGARVATWTRLYQDGAGRHQKIAIENALIIPLCNEKGSYRNLQAIFPAESPELGRGKDFLPFGELSGLFYWIGAEKTNPVLIAEGFATAATLHEETGYRVYIAFTAGNLMAVGQLVRKHLPDVKIIFCADNDEKTPGNPGVTKANEAALSVNGYVAVPPIVGDFNDYALYLQDAK